MLAGSGTAARRAIAAQAWIPAADNLRGVPPARTRPLSQMYKYLSSHLQLKLVAVVMLGVAVAFSVIGWQRIAAAKSDQMEDLRRSGQERVSLVAAASANLLIGYDYSNMEALAERVLSQRDVQQVLIKNAAGKVMVRRQKKAPVEVAGLDFEAPVVFSSETIGTASIRLSTNKFDEDVAAIYAKVVIDQLGYGLTLGLLIYFAASRTIVKPITRISDQMKDIMHANFAAVHDAVQVGGNDEISGLGRIFNDLTQQVYVAQQKLQQKVDLAHTSLMATNRELHERTRALEDTLALVEKLAVTDALTQLHNRRYFDDRLAVEFSRSRRFGEPLTLMLLDVDHFKRINDSQGHAAGDALLQDLAKVFAQRCRDADVVARIGGDEFAFLLYHTSLDAGNVFANELLGTVNACSFVFHDRDLKLGLSIGLACTLDSVNSTESLYGAADLALYEAKRRGRNRYASYPF